MLYLVADNSETSPTSDNKSKPCSVRDNLSAVAIPLKEAPKRRDADSGNGFDLSM